MRKYLMAAATAALALGAQAASAQDAAAPDTTTAAPMGTPVQSASDFTPTFRGFRIEGNAGGDRFQAGGRHNDKFGYGGSIGFDGQIGHIVVGPEASFWRANGWNQRNVAGQIGGTVSTKSFEEYGAAVRIGYLVGDNLLVFGKGGYVNNEQRKRFDAPAGETSYYNHYRTDGYQVGGGLEYTLPTGYGIPAPVYVSAQYVYSNYDDHTARQRLMGGIGLRFK